MLGVLFLLGGIVFLLTIIGFLFGVLLLIVGIVLIASGLSAREDTARIEQQQRQTNYLLQQQIAMNAAHPTAYAPAAPIPTSAERYCPSCGQGNSRSAAFCQRCGKPLPPPP